MDSKKGGMKTAVKEAMAGKYQFNTGGADKKGRRPGFSKAGASTAKQEKRRKGMAPTQGSDGSC